MLPRPSIRMSLSSIAKRMDSLVSHQPALGPPVASEIVATSATGLPIKLHHFGNPQANLRVLVVAGQCGSEAVVQESLNRWAAWLGDGENEPRRAQTLALANLAVLPIASPDSTNIRRDNVELRHAESRALHRVIQCWQPNLIVELETFPSRQQHLATHDLELCHDVFFDIPTNPAACEGTQHRLDEQFLAYAISQLSRQSILASRYMRISRKGNVRHASGDLHWGRNLWAVRFGIPTVMIVGRKPVDSSDSRSIGALTAALQTTIDWSIEKQQRLREPAVVLHPGEEVTVAARYSPHHAPAKMIFFRPSMGKLDQVELPGRFTPRMKESRKVEAPAAYAVHRSSAELLGLLERQGVQSASCGEFAACYRPARMRGVVFAHAADWNADEYRIFPTQQPGGRLLCLLLEAASNFQQPEASNLQHAVVRLETPNDALRSAA